MNSKLRIGILLDDNEIPAWSYKMLQQINNSNSSEIVLIVKNEPETVKEKSLLNRIISNHKSIVYLLYTRIEKKLFKVTHDAFELKDIREILPIDTITVSPKRTKFRDIINDADLKEIENYKIDIFIRLGFRILSGGIINAAKHGIWSFHHGDNKVNRGGPAGFWEVVEHWPETGVTLQILTEDLDGGTVLYKSYSLTDYISLTRNKNNYFWKALSMLPQKIDELYNLGEANFYKRVNELNKHPEFYTNRLFLEPTNRKMFVLGIKLLSRYLKSQISRLFYFDQWILLFKLSKQNSISTSFFQFKRIIPPKDRFWADPHIIERNNKFYIFIEELIYKHVNGHISVIEMDKNGKFSPPVKVLERDYHLSYPFLIEDKGILYMIPETSQNNTIELYKCVEFPLKWKLEMTLMENIKALDSTIIFKDGRYWLFANVVRNKGASSLDELFLFSSDNLLSKNWVSHPQNPIVSDVKKSRPAGKFFIYKDNLYRPSQNCSNLYGYGMKINQVIELSETNYEEEVVDNIFPNWKKDLIATHTINSVDNLTVIDALVKRTKF